jgi:uncharacterized protein YmfQ (DUF2313 family)
MSDIHVRRTGSDYREAFFSLLPNGPAWPKRVVESVLWQTSDGLCEYWGFVDGRAADLLETESDPRQTVELLPDWERNWGLPDPCYTSPQTIDARQTALVARMTMLGGQSRQWFIEFAAKLGYSITISEYRPFMVGLDRCGDNRVYGDDGGGPLYYNNMFVCGYLPVYDPNGVPLASVPSNEGVASSAGVGSANGAGRRTTPGVGFGEARGIAGAVATGRAAASARATAAGIGAANGVSH